MFDSLTRNIHYLRLSVTDLCNLRCRYCMPDGVEKLEREAVLTYEEFLRLAALESGIPVKLNCVPQAGVNEGELEDLAALAENRPLQVRFIEMMPIGYGAAMSCISGPELRQRFARRWPELQPLAEAAFGDGPAVYYTVPGWARAGCAWAVRNATGPTVASAIAEKPSPSRCRTAGSFAIERNKDKK